MEIVTIDFETKKIEPRPAYPPKPVGVSIKVGNKKSIYYAWGHPTGNNCTLDDALRHLGKVWIRAAQGKCQLLFHNAKFDIDIAESIGMPRLAWKSYHDTMILAFLYDPHADTLALKPLAERLLGLSPDEQDAVKEWLLTHYKGARLTEGSGGKNYWAAFISEAPGWLVGDYARGDVDRTYNLFVMLYSYVVNKRRMGEAYDRERRLLLHLIDNERQGARVDTDRLGEDCAKYAKVIDKVDSWIVKQLGDININSNQQLAIAMLDKGLIDKTKLNKTPSGEFSMAKDSVANAVINREWSDLLGYRSQISTCLNTFMLNWLDMASHSDNLIFTSWNQVRQAGHGKNIGARTGRLSSAPNF